MATSTQAVPDLIRHDKDERGGTVLWCGGAKAVPAFEIGETGYVIARTDLHAFVREAWRLGWNAKTASVQNVLDRAKLEIDP